MTTTKAESEIRRVALKDAENIARLFDLGTPDGNAIGDAIKKYADAEFRDDTTMNTGAASLSDEQKKQIAAVVHRDCTLLPGANFYTAAELAIQATLAQISRATPTPQADAAPINDAQVSAALAAFNAFPCPMNGCISRSSNAEQMRAALVAAIAAGGAQEPVRTLPQPVIDALRFYAHGHHFNIDDDHQQFDTVSGEPQNWLMSEREDDCTMIEDGSIAKAVLLGGLPGFEEPTEPLEGEVFAAPLPRVAATGALTDEQMMAAIKSVCGFDAEKAEQWRPEALTIGRAVERALLAASNGEQA